MRPFKLNVAVKPARLARAIAVRLAVVSAVLFVAQDRLILHPGPADERNQVTVTRPGWASDWAQDGRFLGKVYSPEHAAKGTMLVYHGNAGTIDDRERLAQELTSRGWRAVLVEYPGFGNREGWATVNGAVSAGSTDFAYAQRQWPGPIYLVGESFGAGVAAHVAGQNPAAVKGVLLFTPWDSLRNVVDAKFRGIPVGLLLHRQMDSASDLSHFPGLVSIVAAEADTLIPVAHARALAKSLPAARYRELHDAEHNTWPAYLTRTDWDNLLDELTGSAVP